MTSLGKPKPAMFDAFADAMEARYPGVLDRSQPWLYSIAGGAMIQMKLYFASTHEYIMIWGTPIGSEGHSGRHRVGFWDTVIDGETWYYAEGEFERRVYRPGDRIYVGPGQACGMNFTDGVWAVEYARGPLPTSIPFGLADELLSCLDAKSALQTLSLYTDLACQHAGRRARPAWSGGAGGHRRDQWRGAGRHAVATAAAAHRPRDAEGQPALVIPAYGRPQSARSAAATPAGSCASTGARRGSSHLASASRSGSAMAVQPAVGDAGPRHRCRKMQLPAPRTGCRML